MKIITWNVNSIRTRRARLLALLERHRPDVVCLQETKVPDEVFPREVFEAAGYHVAVHGQRGGYNGVAILSRAPLEGVLRGFEGDPIPDEARVISADVAGIRIVSVYVVNGQSMESDKFPRKLAWLDALAQWIDKVHQPTQPLIVAGDFNIAPDARDLHDPTRWEGKLLCTPPERERLAALYAWGLEDLLRATGEEGQVFSWWDYRYGAFGRDMGLRIDLILGTSPMVTRCREVTVDRRERDPKSAESKPSDHAPVIARFADA